MKIIINDTLYVQKIDLDFIRYRLHLLPQSIISKIYENDKFDIDDYDKYDFFKFEDPEDIRFFKNIDWIIDYGPLKDLHYTQITPYGRELVNLRDQIAKKLYSINSDDEEYKDYLLQYTLLDYQISSLNDISDYKMGLLKMHIPNENIFKRVMKLVFTKK